MSKYISSNQLWDNIQNQFSPQKEKDYGSIVFEQDFGKMDINYFSTGSGISYSTCLATFKDDIILEGQYDSNLSYLIFNTGCTAQTLNKDESDFKNSSYCKGKRYEGSKQKVLYAKNKQYVFHYLLFEDDLFKSLIENETVDSSNNVYKQIQLEQNLLLNQLYNTFSINSKFQEIYFESKVLELICSVVKDINKPTKENDIYLSKQDIESLQRAKKILIENIQNPPSLKALSYKSAINEFKLKKGFKQLFGNTVYGFLQEYRLNEAKKLLESNDINISEAAIFVGYKNVSHFSTAFKKYFGIAPIEIKKQNRKYYI